MENQKTAMVWGAYGGIGKALVEKLNSDGWRVVAVGRNQPPDDVPAHLTLEADACDEFAVKSAVMTASQEFNQIDLWIYAAGDITFVPVQKMTLDVWQRILNNNLTGAYLTARHSLPLLAPDAHLFFLGAVSERLRLPGLAAYAAAKAALEAFADSLRKEERKRKVTVVRPGAVDTPLWQKVPMTLPKHYATPEKVAERILDAYKSGQTGQLDLV